MTQRVWGSECFVLSQVGRKGGAGTFMGCRGGRGIRQEQPTRGPSFIPKPKASSEKGEWRGGRKIRRLQTVKSKDGVVNVRRVVSRTAGGGKGIYV
jgi:hypothetical protein